MNFFSKISHGYGIADSILANIVKATLTVTVGISEVSLKHTVEVLLYMSHILTGNLILQVCAVYIKATK